MVPPAPLTPIAERLAREPVIVVIVGNKLFPRTAEGAAVLRALHAAGVEFTTVDPSLRPDDAAWWREHTHDAPLPQLFVAGRQLGGAAQVLELAARGELGRACGRRDAAE